MTAGEPGAGAAGAPGPAPGVADGLADVLAPDLSNAPEAVARAGLDALVDALLREGPDPRLDGLLPRWPSEADQRTYTGTSGRTLVSQSLPFLDYVHEHVPGIGQPGWRGLDFGVGWGRLASLMLALAPPSALDVADAWDSSEGLCRAVGLRNRWLPVPDVLTAANSPLGPGSYDLVYAFSVYTHLPPDSFREGVRALLLALRPGGRLLVTVRPPSFVAFYKGLDPARAALPGFDGSDWFVPTHSERYGEAVITDDTVERAVAGRAVVEHRYRPGEDPFQQYLLLRRVDGPGTPPPGRPSSAPAPPAAADPAPAPPARSSALNVVEAFEAHRDRPAASVAAAGITVHVLPAELDSGLALFAEGRRIPCPVEVPGPGAGAADGTPGPYVPVLVHPDRVPPYDVPAGGGVHVLTSLHTLPLATFDALELWGELASPDYRAMLAALLPDNHWRLETAFLVGDTLHVFGWVLAPDGPAPDGRVPRIVFDGEPARVTTGLPSPYAAYGYWFHPRGGACGFAAVGRVDPRRSHLVVDWLPEDGLPRHTPKPYAVSLTMDRQLVVPPVERIRRVAGPDSSAVTYVAEGVADTLSLRRIAAAHGVDPADPAVRVLEWGSGCGRMTQHLTALPGGPGRVVGADVDADNVAWCQRELPGRFVAVPLEPPAPEVPDASADLIVSHSVLTHLTADLTRAWLRELARWLAPGGLAVLTYHGESSSLVNLGASPQRTRALLATGHDASVRSADLDGVLGDDEYYRQSFATDAYMRGLFSECFELVAVHPAATSGFQNAAVLRRRA